MRNPATTALAFIKKHGLLLEADGRFTSLVTMIAGEAVKGSWWGHPQGKLIFNTANDLADHPDILCVKLVLGKVTFVHRDLWPEVVAVGAAREPWQILKLPEPAKALLTAVDRAGALRTDEISAALKAKLPKPGAAIAELEKRLLALTQQFHGDSGAHFKHLMTWEHWSAEHKVRPANKVAAAKAALEKAAAAIDSGVGKVPFLWQAKKKGA